MRVAVFCCALALGSAALCQHKWVVRDHIVDASAGDEQLLHAFAEQVVDPRCTVLFAEDDEVFGPLGVLTLGWSSPTES